MTADDVDGLLLHQVSPLFPPRILSMPFYGQFCVEFSKALFSTSFCEKPTVRNVALIFNKANIRIMEVVAKRLKIPMEKVITNLSKYGNTSAASIPLALDEAVRTGKVKKGDVIACAGFGAGLSWGSAIFRWGGEE
mmetsp:Transcript_25211/g.74074  ORF Transcript_25211/g.74074 Transcript_25211/m.74074 type:complete len:136 (+) Transcript_25211:3-410(+)